MGTYLEGGESLYALLSAETLVLWLVTVHSVGRNEWVQSESGLAVFRCKSLTVLS